MEILYFLSAGLLFYTFFIYPALLVAAGRIFKRAVKADTSYIPNVSLIISAYNEESVIEDKIKNSLELDYPSDKLEIIVASEAVDGTNEIVKRYEKEGVKLFFYENREGKRATLFKTVPRAAGEVILFSDANGIYNREAIREIVKNFADGRIGAVSGRLKYKDDGSDIVAFGENIYWEMEYLIKKSASNIFHLAGCGGVNGSIFAIRKELYNPISKYRGDDFEITCRIEIAGYGVIMEDKAISYEVLSKRGEDEFKRKVRLAAWNLKSAFILFGEAFGKGRFVTAILLLSHRIFRYFTVLFLMLIFSANFFLLEKGPFFRVTFAGQALFYLIALFGIFVDINSSKKSVLDKVISFCSYFCMANFASLLAIINVLKKKEKNFWEKTRE